MQRSRLLTGKGSLPRPGRRKRGRLVARLLAGAWRASPPPPELRPEELPLILPALMRRGTAGLAWRRLRGTPLEGHPDARPLLDAYRHQTLMVRLRERQLLEVLGFFRRHGIDPVVFKGWSVGRFYPEAGLRPYGDLDLLVPSGDHPHALALWSGRERPDAPVEIHDTLRHLRDRPEGAILGRARVASLGDAPVRVLALEDHLRLLALHALEHGLATPFWLCDLGVLLEGPIPLESSFDWDLCLKGEGWLSHGVRLALGLAGELLGVDLCAAGVPAPWRDPPLPSWIVPAALDALGAETHYMDGLDPGSLLGRPRALLGAARLRWANPLEATYRMGAPWEGPPRLPVQAADYLRRGLGFLGEIPRHLSARRQARGLKTPER